MENALMAAQILFYILGGIGIFFMGISALWFTSVYKDKNTSS